MSVAEILSNCVSRLPSVSVSQVAQANYTVYKFQRLKSVYNKIVREADRLSKDGDLSFPLIPVADMVRSRLSRLDYKILIPPPVLDAWFKEVKDAAALSAFTGYEWPSSPARFDVIFRNAAERGVRARAEALVFRIVERLSEGGYPLFWTLTIDPRHDGILAPRRREFELWLRKVRRQFGDFEYCAVTERGEEGRLHMHCLFIFASASKFSDPNAYGPGKKMEVPELKAFWPYGFGSPIAVRYGPTDHYGLLGWSWPVGLKTGSPAAVARYMAGYITKPTNEVDGCRSKMTRGFGLRRLQAEMSLSEALLIMAGDPLPLLSRLPFQIEPPMSILRACAAKKILRPVIPDSLPETRNGSVREASKVLTMEKFTRMKHGDSLNRGADFNWQLDQYRKLTAALRIGRI